MSPELREISPENERIVLLVRASKIIRQAMGRYRELYSRRVGEYRVVGLAREPGDKELIHPLVLCRIGTSGTNEPRLKALGGFPEAPYLAKAEVRREAPGPSILEVYWGKNIELRSYRDESPILFNIGRGTGGCFLLKGTRWPDEERRVEGDLEEIMEFSTNSECQRLLEGIQRAMGIR